MYSILYSAKSHKCSCTVFEILFSEDYGLGTVDDHASLQRQICLLLMMGYGTWSLIRAVDTVEGLEDCQSQWQRFSMTAENINQASLRALNETRLSVGASVGSTLKIIIRVLGISLIC